MDTRSTKFELGHVIVTPSATNAMAAAGQEASDLLARHQAGDWGEISDQERHVNELGLNGSYNIVSIFPAGGGQRVTIMTKGDRSMTLVHIDPRHAPGAC
jgi:hypothetical protein